MRTRRTPREGGGRGRQVHHHKWFNTIATCATLFGVFWLLGHSNLDRKTPPAPVPTHTVAPVIHHPLTAVKVRKK